MKILMIDDTKSIHAFVKAMLARSPGIVVTSAMNGLEGFEALQKGGPFDLILLDWEMPVLTGPETINKIKSAGIQTPILMMTTKNTPEDISKALGLGAAEYMMKPFTIDILFEKMSFVLGKPISYAA